jgi:hypothetical protein
LGKVEVINLPELGFAKHQIMPVEACRFHYKYANCIALLRLHPGDCCVFCSRLDKVSAKAARGRELLPGYGIRFSHRE